MPYYYCEKCLKEYQPSSKEIELSNLKKEVHMCYHKYVEQKSKMPKKS